MIEEGVTGKFIPFREPLKLSGRIIKFYENLMKPNEQKIDIRAIHGWETISLQHHTYLVPHCRATLPREK